MQPPRARARGSCCQWLDCAWAACRTHTTLHIPVCAWPRLHAYALSCPWRACQLHVQPCAPARSGSVRMARRHTCACLTRRLAGQCDCPLPHPTPCLTCHPLQCTSGVALVNARSKPPTTFHAPVGPCAAVIRRLQKPCTGTPQGLSANSTWARGQGWGIYGFTLAYRYTKNPKFLEYAAAVTGAYMRLCGRGGFLLTPPTCACLECLPSGIVLIRSRTWTLRPPTILYRLLPYHTVPYRTIPRNFSHTPELDLACSRSECLALS